MLKAELKADISNLEFKLESEIKAINTNII